MISRLILSVLALGIAVGASTAHAQRGRTPGCEDLRSVRAVIEFSDAAREVRQGVKEAFRALCSELTPSEGSSVYYPNGKLATHYARREGATWYYENGQLITHYAGREGATWYYKNGQLLTHYMGREGATWYYENGSQWMSRGPAIPAERLLNPLLVLSRFIRNHNNWD